MERRGVLNEGCGGVSHIDGSHFHGTPASLEEDAPVAGHFVLLLMRPMGLGRSRNAVAWMTCFVSLQATGRNTGLLGSSGTGHDAAACPAPEE